MANNTIVVVGSCMIDFVSYTERLPQIGETIHGSEFVTNFGGKGANQCVAAAKLGGNTTMVARVGGDIWGDKYIENLREQGVNTTLVQKTDNSTTGIAQIIVSQAGDNQIVIVAGANKELGKEDVAKARDVIEKATVVVLQLETPIEVALETLKIAKGITILNGAPALAKYDPQLLKLPTIFCVNESEANIFTQLPVTSIDEAKIAANNLLDRGCSSVLITLGALGAIYLAKNGQFFHVASPKVHSVDSTGAGDAFIGALAYVLAENEPGISMERAIKAACWAAADSVTKYGTQKSFPGPDVLKNMI